MPDLTLSKYNNNNNNTNNNIYSYYTVANIALWTMKLYYLTPLAYTTLYIFYLYLKIFIIIQFIKHFAFNE